MDKEQLNQLFLKLQKAGFFSDGKPVKVKVHVLGSTQGFELANIPGSIGEKIMSLTTDEGQKNFMNEMDEIFGPAFRTPYQGGVATQKETVSTSKHTHTTPITTLTEEEKEQVKLTVLNLASNGQVTELSRVAEELCQAMIVVKNFGATSHI